MQTNLVGDDIPQTVTGEQQKFNVTGDWFSCKETKEIRAPVDSNIRLLDEQNIIAQMKRKAKSDKLYLNLWFSNDIFLQKPITKCSGDCEYTAYTPSTCRRVSFPELNHLVQ